MCCLGYNNPNAFDFLKPGDEIRLRKGIGMPEIEAETTDIVHVVNGGSLLTAGGIRLNCHDLYGVGPTGNHFPAYTVSFAAQAILDGQDAFRALRVGDEIHIEDGYGMGTVGDSWELIDDPEGITDIVAIIDEEDHTELVTAKGVLVYLRAWEGVKATGRHFDTFDINSEVREYFDL